jgi:conjugal transfer pilus assembly protein TraB
MWLAMKHKNGKKGIFAKLPVKSKQLITVGIVAVVATICLLGVFIAMDDEGKERREGIEKKRRNNSKEVQIETVGGRINPEETWRFRMQEQSEDLSKNISEVKGAIESAIAGERKSAQRDNLELKDKINWLEQRLIQTKTEKAETIVSEKQLAKITISLEDRNAEDEELIKTIGNTIPAGSFAKATLLGGVDASAALSSSSDPRPLLLRFVDHGVIPRQFRGDLQDCHVIASSYGDISSERVYARIEKLTCVDKKDGRIVEASASGYIAGEDGRAGIRGKVIAKDGALLASGLGVGILGGIGKALTPKPDIPNPFSGANKTLKAPSEKSQFTMGMGEGVSSAMDKLSQYYIDRAEQIQPVVQVSAGRLVDIVFTEGVTIDPKSMDRSVKQNQRNKQNKQTKQHGQSNKEAM